ncbi:hypothetical protein BATDEDRAFT_92246 [Batrachochytrium dendrobatidis JAM81]|uniref:t-SNARE coiled-coil homology domain-containing protein n=1 Tax=Batrachochytrium dendrobatidis (strain JAM81 / FGSC 10211) TaxID=684364 RepID=F4PCK2_BATDJ|nr:uncharacterized protein BATDEDRAFT_92246 [Batrachochytrium dendrobatidis JAM81]EGF76959.1 hypothetical protein BATDEDRAFT_92246 [Batrachochytrium dendrobatidis JAM81]|eukprot:XP_006682518.1 hypothetical protein BATDEDRAFT_92246 [Batrachochytrium dendrobatidis JAM81]
MQLTVVTVYLLLASADTTFRIKADIFLPCNRPPEPNGASGSSNPDRNNRIRQEQNERLLESGNDSLTDALHSKVSKIKNISIRMQDDVDLQNRDLDDMSTSFDSVGNQMKRTVNKLKVVISQPHFRQTMMIAFGIVFLFLTFIFWSRGGRFTRPPS